jgi:hypothetical protein
VSRPRKPTRVANSARNARAEVGRHRRWAPARDAFWAFLEPHLAEGARVAVLGAGNADTLPLRRIAARAGAVTLIDIDPRASREARRRVPWRARRRVEAVEHDVTEGAADRIVTAALYDEDPGEVRIPESPLPGAPYDLAIGDLLYSQLLYPALLDLEVEEERRADFLRRYAPVLARATVARLHASAPLIVHVHDPLAWWDGHEQPVDLDRILNLAEAGDGDAARAEVEAGGIDAALAEVARGLGPVESDPRAALRDLGIEPGPTALWRWPFTEGVDYLACATLASGALSRSAGRSCRGGRRP